MNNTKFKSKTYQKRPLSIIVGGLSKLGLELADILLKNDGYVIFVDNYNKENLKKLDDFSKDSLISFIDYSALQTLDEDLKRLDYVFFLNNAYRPSDISQKYLSKRKSYLDIILSLSAKYRAKFLLATATFSLSDKLSDTDDSRDIEFKKYAEKLTREYINKVKLNGRIVVLGEILGDGIDFGSNSIISNLILNAAKGEALMIPKKGMQKEWFIQNMDAAYALFKAQFSRVTNEKTYLASYEYPYTYISIAYKIQEIESDAQDIEFMKDEPIPNIDNSKLPVSLTEIGWSPKISLDKALKQSISSAKIYLLETLKGDEKKGLMKRFKTFFELDNSEDLNDKNKVEGPVGRLIMERKRQEEQTRRLLSENSKLMEDHKMRRPSQLTDAIEESSRNIFEKLGDNFRSLRSKKKSTLFKYFIVVSTFLLIYFFVISPIVVISRNAFVVGVSYGNLIKEMDAKDYNSMQKSAENISFALGDTNTLLSKYSFIFRVANKEELLTTIQDNLFAYKLYSDGVVDISSSLNPLIDYLETFQSNISQRSAQDGYLATEGDVQNYEDPLLDLSNGVTYLKMGMDKIESSINKFSQIDYTVYPSQISESLISLNQQIRNQKTSLDLLESVEYIPEIMGLFGEKSYAFMLFDNTNPTPIGGELRSIIYLKVLNGYIKDIQVKRVDDPNLKWSSSNAAILEDINVNRFNSIETISKSSDYETTNNFSQYANSLSEFFVTNFGGSVNGVISLNYSALEDFIYRFSGNYNFESDGINFSKESLLGYFEKISEMDDAKTKSYEVPTDLFSQLFYYFSQNIGSNVEVFFTQSYEELKKQNLYIDMPDSGYSKYIENQNLNFTKINSVDIFIKPSIHFNESSVKTDYLNVDMKTNLLVTADGIVSFKVNLLIPSVAKNSEVSLCIPLFVNEKDIQIAKIASSQVKINRNGSEQCVVLEIKEESEVEVGWNIRNFIISEKPIELEVGLGKMKGVKTKLDFNLSLESGVKLVQVIPALDQNYSLSEDLSSDKGIKLTISK